MIKNSKYLPIDFSYPFKGLHTFGPSTRTNPNFFQSSDNVSFERNFITKRPGYTKLGSDLTGDVMLIDEFIKIPLQSIVTTTTGVFKYDSTNDEYDEILLPQTIKLTYAVKTLSPLRFETFTQGTTNATGKYLCHTATHVYLTQTSETDFDASHTITGSYSGCTFTVSVLLEIPHVWNGTEDNVFLSSFGNDQNGQYLFITNGKNVPLIYDGNILHAYLPQGISDLEYVNSGFFFEGRLFLGGISSGGVTELSWIYISQPGDIYDHESLMSDAFQLDNETAILRLEKLGTRLVCYGTTAHTLEYLGDDYGYAPVRTIDYLPMVSGRAVVNLTFCHLILTKSNVIVNGEVGTQINIADEITEDIQNDLDLEYSERAYGFRSPQQDKVYFIIPISDTLSYIYVLESRTSDFSDRTWTRWILNDRIKSFGTFRKDSTLTWTTIHDIGTNWEDYIGEWKSGQIRAGYPLLAIGGNTKMFTFSSESLDAGISSQAVLMSEDVMYPELLSSIKVRWVELELELKGDSVGVMVSADEGDSWLDLGVISLQKSKWLKYRAPGFEIIGTSFRFKFYSTEHFEMRWGRVWSGILGVNA